MRNETKNEMGLGAKVCRIRQLEELMGDLDSSRGPAIAAAAGENIGDMRERVHSELAAVVATKPTACF